MVYVHLVEKDIPASADEVWELLGPNFVDIVEWSTCHSHSRSLKEGEIPKKFHPSKNKAFIRNAPVLGRVVQNIFHGKGELAQTITMYVKARKELTYSCAFPLPIVDIYECTIIVNQQKDGNASVEMECCLYVVPGFCWLAGE